MAGFAEVIELQLDRFGPAQAKAWQIAIARRGLADFLARQSEPSEVSIEVDGHSASSEDQVQPFGVITYRFLRLPAIGRYAIAAARDLSPEASGRYKASWFLLADGTEASENAIPANTAELTLSNDQPYARKIEVRGAHLLGVPPGIVERVRQLVLRRFGDQIDAEIRFLNLEGGYTLKGRAAVRRNAGGRRRASRKDTGRGRALTYPALVISPRV